MYDWANSAVQTTIITAVFPIYFVKVAGAGLPESGATQRLATINTIALVIIALALAHPRRHLRLRRDQEAVARRVHGARRRRGGGCSSSCTRATSTWRPGSSSLATDRRERQLRLLRGAAARTSPARARSTGSRRAGYALGYLGGGLLLALNLAWIQKPDWFGLPSARTRRAEATLPVAARVPLGGRLVAGLLDPALPAGARAAARGSSRTSRRARARCGRHSSGWARRSASCGATGRRS